MKYLKQSLILFFFVFLGLLSAGAMGLWHGVEYYEKERAVGEEFYQQWSNVRSHFHYLYKIIIYYNIYISIYSLLYFKHIYRKPSKIYTF